MVTHPYELLQQRLKAAMVKAFGDALSHADPMLRPAQNPRFGDYQANAAMGLAKELKAKPRDVAGQIVAALDVADVCSKVEIAGPGFINLTVADAYLGALAGQWLTDARLGIARATTPDRVVVDYSSPNVAKEMHVGHLRSTVIGDALVRVLAFLGHDVIRQNHMGDWGTQFGMLIEHLCDQGAAAAEGKGGITDLNAFYQEAKKRFDADSEFAERARRRVVALQSGDELTLAHWRRLVGISQQHFNVVYRRLNVSLTDADVKPESAYNALLADIVETLSPLTQVDQGAVCIFVPGYCGADGAPVPMIVKKTDGGFGYAATDLAALRLRVQDLAATRLVYVVDARQSDHFAQVFWVGTKMGWLGEGRARAEHVRFGTILGEDNKPFKTRSGDTVRLADLLDEAEARALKIVLEKNPSLDVAEQQDIARVVGIGAVKYADLASDRIKDYVFSWDRMLAMDGNTAPYLQYAYARIRSIFRKGEIDVAALGEQPLALREPVERALVARLCGLEPTIDGVAQALEPHRLCSFLFDLAATFNTFYNAVPVLKAEDPTDRRDRLALCELCARALKLGLELLGIETVERM